LALRRCVAPPPGAFLAEHWERRPLLSRAADLPGGYDDLLCPGDVDELLGPRALRLPFFRLVQDGSGIDARSCTRAGVAGDTRLTDLPDPDRIAERYAAGATIVLNSLHRVWPPLGSFCRELAAELGHPVQVNAYVTPPGAQGFTPHHDTHDVFVLQVDGGKSWTVAEPVVELPLASQPSSGLPPGTAASSPVALCATLRPGDALYLPRGWVHSAATTDERSIHLTVGVLGATWYDVLGDLVAGAADEPAFRRLLPPPGATDEDPAGFLRRAADWLAAVPPQRVEAAVTARRARAVPPEPLAPLAQAEAGRVLAPGSALRPRAGLPGEVRTEGDQVVLRVPGRELRLPSYTEEAVRLALAARFTPAELALDPADALVLCRRLLREGIVVPAT